MTILAGELYKSQMRGTLLLALLLLTACESFQRKNRAQAIDPIADSAGPAPTSRESVPPGAGSEAAASSVNATRDYRLGLILGPGGAKAFAHIGFLREIQARKIPVHALVGLEWGALIAASFAVKGSAHEAEWQLSKIRDPGSVWSAGQATPIREVIDSLKPFLSGASAEGLKIPFSCPSLNLKKGQVYQMTKGRLDQMLPYCLSYPPQFAPFERTIAGVREIQLAADQLRKMGANYVIFVNVLAGGSQEEPLNWIELGYDMKRKYPGVNERLDLVISDRKITDFKFRQEMIQLGADQSAAFVEKLTGQF
jgi:NTE family protein